MVHFDQSRWWNRFGVTSQLLQSLTWLETTFQKQWNLALKQKGCDPIPANEI